MASVTRTLSLLCLYLHPFQHIAQLGLGLGLVSAQTNTHTDTQLNECTWSDSSAQTLSELFRECEDKLRVQNATDEEMLVLRETFRLNTQTTTHTYMGPRKLLLSGNSHINTTGIHALAQILQFETFLEVLDLSGIPLAPEAVMEIARSVSTNKHLRKLSLYNCSLDERSGQVLGEMLALNAVLETLNVGYNSMGDEGIMEMSRGLSVNRNLRELLLYKCFIGTWGVQAIVRELTGTRSAVEHLLLNSNIVGIEACQDIGRMLRVNQALKKLRLSDCSITHWGMIEIANALSDAPSSKLEDLDVSYNAVSDFGIVPLAQALASNRNLSLRRLDLTSVLVTQVSTLEAIADALTGNYAQTNVGGLEELRLGKNLVGEHGAAVLAKALRKISIESAGTRLTLLDLSQTGIMPTGARAIVDALKGNIGLRVLDLRENDVGTDLAARVASVRKSNPHLEVMFRESYDWRDEL